MSQPSGLNPFPTRSITINKNDFYITTFIYIHIIKDGGNLHFSVTAVFTIFLYNKY